MRSLGHCQRCATATDVASLGAKIWPRDRASERPARSRPNPSRVPPTKPPGAEGRENRADSRIPIGSDTAATGGVKTRQSRERMAEEPGQSRGTAARRRASSSLSRTGAREGVDTYRLDPTALRKVHILQVMSGRGRGEARRKRGSRWQGDKRSVSLSQLLPPRSGSGTHPVEETGMEVMRIESLVLRHCSLESVCACVCTGGQESNSRSTARKSGARPGAKLGFAPAHTSTAF